MGEKGGRDSHVNAGNSFLEPKRQETKRRWGKRVEAFESSEHWERNLRLRVEATPAGEPRVIKGQKGGSI